MGHTPGTVVRSGEADEAVAGVDELVETWRQIIVDDHKS
jgi:hypothetical protein